MGRNILERSSKCRGLGQDLRLCLRHCLGSTQVSGRPRGLPHLGDEKTESDISSNLCLFICSAADVFVCWVTGAAPRFTGAAPRFICGGCLSAAGKVLSSGTVCPGIWGQGWGPCVTQVFAIPAADHPHWPCVPDQPRFLSFPARERPASDRRHGTSQPTDRRCCLCLPTAPE